MNKDTGLRSSRTCRSNGHRPARAGKCAAFPDPARSGGEQPDPAAMAKSISFAAAIRCQLVSTGPPGANPLGLRPPHTPRARATPPAGTGLLTLVEPVLLRPWPLTGRETHRVPGSARRANPFLLGRDDFPVRRPVRLAFSEACHRVHRDPARPSGTLIPASFPMQPSFAFCPASLAPGPCAASQHP